MRRYEIANREDLENIKKNKVDKVEGKDLSDNNFSNAYKLKLNSFESLQSKVTDVETDLTSHKEEYTKQVIKLKNDILNSSFTNGTTNWVGVGCTIASSGSAVEINPTGLYPRITQANSLTINNLYYFKFNFLSDKKLGALTMLESHITPSIKWDTIAGQLTTFSGIGKSINQEFRLNAYLPSGVSNFNEYKSYISKILAIDLTKAFGEGNEPTKEEMDWLLEEIPNEWFDGELTPSQMQILNWNLKRFRDNTKESSFLLSKNTPIDVSGFNSILANIDITWGFGHFEVSYDGFVYETLMITNEKTGSVFSRVDYPGSYQANISNAKKIKWIVDYERPEVPASIVRVTLSDMTIIPQILERNVIYPSPSLLTNVTLKTGYPFTNPWDYHNGTIYFTTGNYRIFKSTDLGATSVQIPAIEYGWGTGDNMSTRHIKKLDSGRLCVWLLDATTNDVIVYTSDKDEKNFIETDRYNIQGIISVGWGISIVGNMIVYTSYATARTSQKLDVKLSIDDGLTWSVIKSAPISTDGKTNLHYHDVFIDPYKSRIWLIQGDQRIHANVYYTDDYGANWYSLWEVGKSPVQFTVGIATPTGVLFGTDHPGIRGIYKFTYGNAKDGFTMEPATIWTKGIQAGDAVSRANDFEKAGACYFASREYISARTEGRVHLIATKDGANFYTLWVSPDKNTSLHLMNVDKTTGKFIARYVVGSTNYLMVADIPSWISE